MCPFCGNVAHLLRAKPIEGAREALLALAQGQMAEAVREVEAHSADLAHRKLADAARQKELEVEERRSRLFVLGMSGLFFVGSIVVLVIGLRDRDGKSALGGGVGAVFCGSLLLALVLQRRR